MDLYDRYGDVRATTFFDVTDIDKVRGIKWSVGADGCPVGVLKGKHTFLYRYLMDAPTALQVDHINGNVLDNRRGNLRLATHAQQRHNVSVVASNTGVKGVSYNRRDKSYIATVWCDHIRHSKVFSSLSEAEYWVRSKREELHGEFTNHGSIS